MIDAPSNNFPFLKFMQGITSSPVMLDMAKQIDSYIQHVCDRVAGQPRRLANLTADGTMQTIAFAPALPREPSIVIASVTAAPWAKIGTDNLALPYTVEYGTHTKDGAQVKISFPSGATPPKFELIVFP